MPTIKRASAEDVLMQGGNKGGGRRGYTDQRPAEGGNGDNKESERRGYADQGPTEGGKSLTYGPQSGLSGVAKTKTHTEDTCACMFALVAQAWARALASALASARAGTGAGAWT